MCYYVHNPTYCSRIGVVRFPIVATARQSLLAKIHSSRYPFPLLADHTNPFGITDSIHRIEIRGFVHVPCIPVTRDLLYLGLTIHVRVLYCTAAMHRMHGQITAAVRHARSAHTAAIRVRSPYDRHTIAIRSPYDAPQALRH